MAAIERSLVLSPDPDSAARARRFAADVLTDWDVPALVDTVTLLISELVTNAILHARTACELVLRLTDRRLRVEVHDRSPVVPSRRDYDPDAGTGRGMLLIEALATDWGTESAADGKRVWFEVVDDVVVDVEADEVDEASVSTPRPAPGRDASRRGGPAGHGPAPARQRPAQLSTRSRVSGTRR